MLRIKRNGQVLPLSADSFHRMRGDTLGRQAERDAYDDGTAVGFFLGIITAMLGFWIISGHMVAMLDALVRAVAHLGGGA